MVGPQTSKAWYAQPVHACTQLHSCSSAQAPSVPHGCTQTVARRELTCQGPLPQQQPGCTTCHSLLPPPLAAPPERHLLCPACQQGEQEGSHALRLAGTASLCSDLYQAQCQGQRVQARDADLGCDLEDRGRQCWAQVDDVHSKRLQQDHKVISGQPLGVGLGNKLGLEDGMR